MLKIVHYKNIESISVFKTYFSLCMFPCIIQFILYVTNKAKLYLCKYFKLIYIVNGQDKRASLAIDNIL